MVESVGFPRRTKRDSVGIRFGADALAVAKALSDDRRARVVSAVAAGASCREAAARFGVSAASVVRWCNRQRTDGTVAPRSRGGDRRTGRIEAKAELILELVARDETLTLAGIQQQLAQAGLAAGIGTIWRFLDRHGIARQARRGRKPHIAPPR